MATVIQRRNHVITSVGLLVAAVLVGVGSRQPVGAVGGDLTGARSALGSLGDLAALAGQLGITGLPDLSTLSTLDPSAASGIDARGRTLLVVAAVVLAVVALVLLAIRRSGWGLVARVVGLVAVTAPVSASVLVWRFLADPVGQLHQSNPLVQAALRYAVDNKVITVSADTGLYLTTAGAVVGLVALLVPALHSVRIAQDGVSDGAPVQDGWPAGPGGPAYGLPPQP